MSKQNAPTQRRYPLELRERAVRLVKETIAENAGDRHGVITRVAIQLGVGSESQWTRVTLTPGRIVYEQRKALLGLIPVGTHTDTYPLANISAVGTATSIDLLKFLGGIVLLAVGALLAVAAALPTSVGWRLAVGVFLILCGIQVALDAFRARFYVSTNGGQHYSLLIAITNKARAQALADQVNLAIVQLHERLGTRSSA